MATQSGGNVPIRVTRACVVYDRDTGHIHHVHQVVTFEGGREPTEKEIETHALALVQRKGRKTGRLQVLHVSPDAVQSHKLYAVDTSTQTLKEKR